MSRSVRAVLLLAAASLAACSPEDGSRSRGAADLPVAEYSAADPRPAGHYGYGTHASAEEIAGWDIDVRPDGNGLPPGGGSVEEGETLYEDLCASCHGSFGEGVGRYSVLAGGEGTLTEPRPEKTVGSFWPYASTLWDYIHRAMPYAAPESLEDNEVYAISAYVLYLNDLVDYDFELTRHNLPLIVMPNVDGFFLDDRPDVANELCMSQCKDPAAIVITSEPPPSAAPVQAVASTVDAAMTPAESIYQRACAMCHAVGVADAPITGEKTVWAERIGQGRDILIASSLNGKGVMPAKGGHTQLSDDEVIAALDYMIEQSVE